MNKAVALLFFVMALFFGGRAAPAPKPQFLAYPYSYGYAATPYYSSYYSTPYYAAAPYAPSYGYAYASPYYLY